MQMPPPVKRFVGSLNSHVQGEKWRYDGMGWVRIRPMQFNDVGMVSQFIGHVNTTVRPPARWRVHVGGETYVPEERREDENPQEYARSVAADCADLIERASRTDPTSRNRLQLWLDDPREARTWSIELIGATGPKDEADGEASTRIRDVGEHGAAHELRRAIDRFMVEIPRSTLRKRDRSLIEPLTLETVQQREHDALISRKAARVGGLWGLGAGTAVAVLVELVSRQIP